MRHSFALMAMLLGGAAWACGACRPLVMAHIAAEPFWRTALLLAVPVVLLTGLALVIHRSGGGR